MKWRRLHAPLLLMQLPQRSQYLRFALGVLSVAALPVLTAPPLVLAAASVGLVVPLEAGRLWWVGAVACVCESGQCEVEAAACTLTQSTPNAKKSAQPIANRGQHLVKEVQSHSWRIEESLPVLAVDTQDNAHKLMWCIVRSPGTGRCRVSGLRADGASERTRNDGASRGRVSA